MHGARILEHGAADYAARMVREEAKVFTTRVLYPGMNAFKFFRAGAGFPPPGFLTHR